MNSQTLPTQGRGGGGGGGGDLEADGMGVFEIDPQSGDITLKAASLQPIVTHYTLEVMAKDGGLNSLEEVAIVHVQVLVTCMCVGVCVDVWVRV